MKALLVLISFLTGVICFRDWLQEKRTVSLCCSLLWFVTCGLHLSALLQEKRDEEQSDYAD